MRSYFKTIYIEVEYLKTMKDYGKVNGDQLSREIQAALNEKHGEGYELERMMPIESNTGSATYTCGYMLFFKLADKIQ